MCLARLDAIELPAIDGATLVPQNHACVSRKLLVFWRPILSTRAGVYAGHFCGVGGGEGKGPY